MEPALKQRLVGAVVLVALAVIFLPMLIKGPAPESGVSSVPLEAPAAPADGEFETRELPLVEPAAAPRNGVVGLDGAAPKPASDGASSDAADAADTATTVASPAEAGGDYAVSFGSYATPADARRVVDALIAAGLPGYQEPYTSANGRALHRVRIGPFADEADAEAARVRAAQVRSDVTIRVVALDADTAPAAPTPAAAPAAAKPESPAPPADSTAKTEPVKAAPARTEPARPEPPKPEPPKPAPVKPVAAAPQPSAPAAADTGFAVQLGAFGDAAEAARLRDRLRGQGFTAFTETVRTDRGALERVRVGPVTTRAEADRLKQQIAARVGIDGIVRPHP